MKQINYFQNLASTNSYLKSNIAKYGDKTVIWADCQDNGHGRFERSWYSVQKKDLTFSLLLKLNRADISLWANITQIAALSIVQLLIRFGVKAEIKWPNDVLVNGKKISGILCEVITHNNVDFAVLGIGLNINSDIKDLSVIDQPATSLFAESGDKINRKDFLNKIINIIIKNYNLLIANNFDIFYDEIKSKTIWIGKKREIISGNQKFFGIIQDLNRDGTLKILKESGELININSGEL